MGKGGGGDTRNAILRGTASELLIDFKFPGRTRVVGSNRMFTPVWLCMMMMVLVLFDLFRSDSGKFH